MNNTNYILTVLLFLICSCKEAAFMDYVDKDRIQFGPNNPELIYRNDYETNWKLQDTTKSFSFYFEKEEVLMDTVYFDLYTLGNVKDYDRSYKLVQVNEEQVNNAIPGVHYQAFDDKKSEVLYKVTAGKAHMRVPIVLLRDPSLKEKNFMLSFKVEANDHFELGASTNIWRKLTFADRLIQPSAWDASAARYYWGAYSVKKHEFMLEVTGVRWDQEFMAKMALDERTYYIAVLKQALAEYNSSHKDNPLRDENNQLIVFP